MVAVARRLVACEQVTNSTFPVYLFFPPIQHYLYYRPYSACQPGEFIGKASAYHRNPHKIGLREDFRGRWPMPECTAEQMGLGRIGCQVPIHASSLPAVPLRILKRRKELFEMDDNVKASKNLARYSPVMLSVISEIYVYFQTCFFKKNVVGYFHSLPDHRNVSSRCIILQLEHC